MIEFATPMFASFGTMLGQLNLDIDGFLTAPDTLSAVAGVIITVLAAIVNSFLAGLFGIAI